MLSVATTTSLSKTRKENFKENKDIKSPQAINFHTD
jgi:hypothetical protein